MHARSACWQAGSACAVIGQRAYAADPAPQRASRQARPPQPLAVAHAESAS
jgi:hypothetical protein